MREELFKAGPEGGETPATDGETPKTKKDSKTMQQILTYLITLIWLGVNAYVLYGFCYNVLWHDIHPRHKKPAIAILVLVAWFNFHAMISFIAIHAYGPGEIGENYSKHSEKQLDEAFISDGEGYQLYCTYCKRIKPNRTHHSANTDKCVPLMDHFCPWVGSVIGQGNYKFFLQYMWSAAFALVVVIVSLLIYQHHTLPNINGNSIALYVVSGFAFLFLSVLIVQHSLYVILSHTTLEHMSYRNGRIPYFNILWRDDQRRVVQPLKREIVMPHSSPFDQGVYNNICEVMGPWYTWPLPIRPPMHEPTLGKKFLERMRARLDEGEPVP